jgi:hypothetical protein
MTSNINPNNINGAYPVAGQDNNSQGFRDNFTNTGTNFQYAANEITDLQNNAILKSALTGTILDNNMQGSVLSNAQLQNMGESVNPLGTLSGTVTVNYALGSIQTVTTNGPISLAFSNLKPAGVSASWIVQVTVASVAHTVTFPISVSVNTAGIQGLNTATNTMEFATTGVYTFEFTTSNGGTTITLNQINNQLTPFNFSAEQITATGNLSLATTSSYFTTSTAIATVLNTGADGQIKTLMASNVSAGNAVVTVVSAGWKATGNGTATFSERGQSCTLQYINSKWYAIGNNGVAFT